jgi:hypothetical protein
VNSKRGIRITKMDAARLQLRTAIRLWFADGDPIAIDTLVARCQSGIATLLQKPRYALILGGVRGRWPRGSLRVGFAPCTGKLIKWARDFELFQLGLFFCPPALLNVPYAPADKAIWFNRSVDAWCCLSAPTIRFPDGNHQVGGEHGREGGPIDLR